MQTGAIARPNVLMIAATVIGLCSCTKGPHGLSADTYEGVHKAVSALRRANEYRDSGALLFEPRLLEAEKAADGIVTQAYSDITMAANTSSASIARTCVEDLNRSPSRNVHQRALDDYNDQEMVNNARQALDGCIATLGGYL